MSESNSHVSVAVTVAEQLRQSIIRGDYPPRTPLREARLAEQLGISRNTLRESLRLLTAEGLVVQLPHRGSSVTTVSTEQVRDIYRVRRVLENSAVMASATASDPELDALRVRIDAAHAARRQATWSEVATAGLKFHQDLVALLKSPILDRLFSTLAAQLRLAYLDVTDLESFEEPWMDRDRTILDLICSGRRLEAAEQLHLYLNDSEQLLLDMRRRAAVAEPTMTV